MIQRIIPHEKLTILESETPKQKTENTDHWSDLSVVRLVLCLCHSFTVCITDRPTQRSSYSGAMKTRVKDKGAAKEVETKEAEVPPEAVNTNTEVQIPFVDSDSKRSAATYFVFEMHNNLEPHIVDNKEDADEFSTDNGFMILKRWPYVQKGSAEKKLKTLKDGIVTATTAVARGTNVVTPSRSGPTNRGSQKPNSDIRNQ